MHETEKMKEAFKEGSLRIILHKENSLVCSLNQSDYLSFSSCNWLRTEAVNVLVNILYEKYLPCWAKHTQDPRKYIRVLDVYLSTMLLGVHQSLLPELAMTNLFDVSTKYWLIPTNTDSTKGQHWFFNLLVNHSQIHPQSQTFIYSQSNTYTDPHYKIQTLSQLNTQINKQSQMQSNNQSNIEINKNNKQNIKRVLYCTLYVFDSALNPIYPTILKQRLEALHRMLMKEQISITVVLVQQRQVQNNTYDCGVCSIGHCEYVLKHIVQSLQNKQMPSFNTFLQHKYLLANTSHARLRYKQILDHTLQSIINNKQ